MTRATSSGFWKPGRALRAAKSIAPAASMRNQESSSWCTVAPRTSMGLSVRQIVGATPANSSWAGPVMEAEGIPDR